MDKKHQQPGKANQGQHPKQPQKSNQPSSKNAKRENA